MPSLVAKIAPADAKGTAMGLFSSAQFLGAFTGGVLGGWMLGNEQIALAFVELAMLLLVWLGIALTMQNPKAVTSRIVSLVDLDENSIRQFRQQAEQLPGVQEITVYLEDRIAYLKVDKKQFAEEELESLMLRR